MAIHGPCYFGFKDLKDLNLCLVQSTDSSLMMVLSMPCISRIIQLVRKQRTTISNQICAWYTRRCSILFVRQGYSVPCVPELDDLTVGGLLDFALCPDESNSSSRSHSREKRHDISWHHDDAIVLVVFWWENMGTPRLLMGCGIESTSWKYGMFNEIWASSVSKKWMFCGIVERLTRLLWCGIVKVGHPAVYDEWICMLLLLSLLWLLLFW